MADTKITKGSLIELKGTFKNRAGTLTDPTAVVCKVKDPEGTITTYNWPVGTVTKDATGVFLQDVTVNKDGTWSYRFEGSGAVVAARESSFFVEKSSFS